jgi:hypothetical protein
VNYILCPTDDCCLNKAKLIEEVSQHIKIAFMHVVILNLPALFALLFAALSFCTTCLEAGPVLRFGLPKLVLILVAHLLLNIKKSFFFFFIINNAKLRLDNAFSLNYIKINKNINPDYSVL